MSQMLLGLLLPQPGRRFEAAACFVYAEWPQVFVDTQRNDLTNHLWHVTLSVPCVTPLARTTTGMTEISFLRPRTNRGRNTHIFGDIMRD